MRTTTKISVTSEQWRTLTTDPCLWVKTSSDGRVYGLAIAYVDDLIAVDEERVQMDTPLWRE